MNIIFLILKLIILWMDGFVISKIIQYYQISLQQHFLMFFSSNLDETGFQRTVSELADQEDSKTPPGNLIWSEIE